MVTTAKLAVDYVQKQLHEEGKRIEKGKNGWDITVKNNDGTEQPIEVKGIIESNSFVLLSDYNTDYKSPEGLSDNWLLWIVVISKEKKVAGQLRLAKQDVEDRIAKTRAMERAKYGKEKTPYKTWGVTFRRKEWQHPIAFNKRCERSTTKSTKSHCTLHLPNIEAGIVK